MDENPKRIDARLEIKVTEHFTPKERERRRRAEKVAEGFATAAVAVFFISIIIGLFGIRLMNGWLLNAGVILLLLSGLLKIGQALANSVYNNPSPDDDDEGDGSISYGPWSYL